MKDLYKKSFQDPLKDPSKILKDPLTILKDLEGS